MDEIERRVQPNAPPWLSLVVMMAVRDDVKLSLVADSGEPELRQLDDDDLMRLAKGGRDDAFEVVVDRHQRLVLGLAVRYLGDQGQGRDVAQDTFCALWAERMRYQPRGRFRSFLVSMTINRCHSVARSSGRERRRMERLQHKADVGAPAPDEPLERTLERERSREVHEKLAQLPARQREVLQLRFGHDLSFEEIAHATAQPLGTVKSHACRAIHRLRTLFQEERRP